MITRTEIEATGLPLTDHEAIAAALSVGRKVLVSKPIGLGTIVAAMYPNGGLFLQALDDMAAVTPATAESTNVKYTMEVIRAASFDVGDETNRAYLQAFASAVPFFATGITALLDLAWVASPVTALDVARALEGV